MISGNKTFIFNKEFHLFHTQETLCPWSGGKESVERQWKESVDFFCYRNIRTSIPAFLGNTSRWHFAASQLMTNFLPKLFLGIETRGFLSSSPTLASGRQNRSMFQLSQWGCGVVSFRAFTMLCKTIPHGVFGPDTCAVKVGQRVGGWVSSLA